MRKMGLFPAEKPKKQYKPKPYTQMTRPRECVQVDVKVVPRRCIADPNLRLFQYTAIDEFTRLRFLAAYPEQSTYFSADFLRRLTEWYARRGIKVECVQTDNGFEFTNRFSTSRRDLPTLFEKQLLSLVFATSLSGPILRGTMERLSAVNVRARNVSIRPISFTLLMTFPSSLLFTIAVPTTYL